MEANVGQNVDELGGDNYVRFLSFVNSLTGHVKPALLL